MTEHKDIKPLSPLLVCIGGLPGTGKTTVGLALLPHLGKDAVFVCPDRTMLRLLGRPEGSAIESKDINPALVAAAVTDMTAQTKAALEAGRPVVVPSAFIGETMRETFEGLAAETGARFAGFWLEAPVALLHDRALQRQKEREQSPKDTFNNASAVGAEHIKEALIQGAVTWAHIRADQSPASVLQDILGALSLPASSAKAEPPERHP